MHVLFSTRPSFLAFTVTALSLALAPSMASASTHADEGQRIRRTARITDSDPSREDHDAAEHACHHAKPSVEIVAGDESASLSLERCDGQTIAASIDKLSILARPATALKPKEPLVTGKAHGTEVAPGIRRLDARLAERLELVADHFRKEGETTKIVLVAGSKSRSAGSYHASGRAIDFRLEGTDDEAVAAFCKTVPDTGCGFYPNSGFVHMDVRDPGTGHVAWIDVSKGGEAPKYVTAWPLKDDPAKADMPASRPTPEPTKEANNGDAAKLPSLPAAVTVAPMETPKTSEPVRAPESVEATPVKKTHKRHHRSHRNDHSF